MVVYRISLEKWSHKLTASGFPARWNSKGKFDVYTAGSTALACLENVVHRNGEGLNQNFKVMTIEIPSDVKISSVDQKALPENWHLFEFYSETQKIGDDWIDTQKIAVLKVPSSIIKREFNYLINPNHREFKLIKLIDVDDFEFDPRINTN